MTRSWSFDLNYSRPPLGLSANDRAHYYGKAKNTALVRFMASMMTQSVKVPKLARCQVDVEWVVKDRRRRDTDNLAPMLKAIYDGIGADKGVSAHIVADDAPEFMTKVGATIRYAPTESPRFVVTITELSA